MEKFYPTLFYVFFFVWNPMIPLNGLLAQVPPKIFTLSDFDLKGKVKSCLVFTHYGKEEFDFNEEGHLTKAVTRFNDRDYDITHYKYDRGELLEKRVENYRDNAFDKSTSYANFYDLDTLGERRITERIVSYAKEFLGQNEYHYDKDDNIKYIRHIDQEGIDEVVVEYADYQGEITVTYLLDEVVQKTVRTSKTKGKSNEDLELILTKDFLNGVPDKAVEQLFDANKKVLFETEFRSSGNDKTFKVVKTTEYKYDDNGMLVKRLLKKEGNETVESFIYQFDDGDAGNWIKQIITPDNTYTTRKITYYPVLDNKE